MTTTQAVAATTDFAEIERLATDGAEVFAGAPSFMKSMQLAETVEKMRGELTPQRMAKIMALMNTSLGFDTDRNPAKWTKQEPCVPYTFEIVRDVVIEAMLRGFYPVNKEFSIIAGNFYGGVNGFERLVKKHAKVTDFKDNYGIPVMGNGGAIIKCSAAWIQEGVPQTLEREFAVRVNTGMGADAIIGKAKKKLFAAVYGRLSGVVTPEGEADDVTDLKATNTAAAPTEQLFGKRAADATGKTAAAPPATATTPPPSAASAGTPQTPEPTAPVSQVNEPETPKMGLIRTLTSSGVKFDDFRDFVKIKNLAKDPESWASYDDLPEKAVTWFTNNPKTLAECIKKFGTLQRQPAAGQ